MCLNNHYIYNKYTGRSQFVACGSCPSCQQKKANKRAQRIVNTKREGYVTLMVLLTYSNDFLPYVRLDELLNLPAGTSSLPVYRDAKVMRKRQKGAAVVFAPEVTYKTEVINHVDVSVPEDLISRKHFFKGVRSAENKPRCVGVIQYNDVQNFFDRLNLNLFRDYGFTDKYYRFCASEYGENHLRPHFHLLFTIPAYVETSFRAAIVKSWMFCDWSKLVRPIEIAIHPEEYVASYVNKSHSFPKVLEIDCFKQKHSYSHDYGLGLSEYSPQAIKSAIDKGTFVYSKEVYKEGCWSLQPSLRPQYVINRYFPKFKGCNRLTFDTLAKLFFSPFASYKLAESECNEKLAKYQVSRCVPSYSLWTIEDARKIGIRLSNAAHRWLSAFGLTFNDHTFELYFNDWFRAWSIYHSDVLRYQLMSVHDWLNYYPETSNFDFIEHAAPTLRSFFEDDISSFVEDYNERPDVVNDHQKTLVKYEKHRFKRKMNSAVTAYRQYY